MGTCQHTRSRINYLLRDLDIDLYSICIDYACLYSIHYRKMGAKHKLRHEKT